MKTTKTNEPVKIEHGVPIPPKKQSKWAVALRAMNVGDSFTVNSRQAVVRVSEIARTICGYKITTRQIEQGVIRIWRIQ